VSPRCMFIPGAMVGFGYVDGAGVAGPIVMPGIGAIVGEGFAAFGAGVAFFAGAGVAIPGMGAIVGWAPRPGETVRAIRAGMTLKRVASKGTSCRRGGILRAVVRHTPNADFKPAVSLHGLPRATTSSSSHAGRGR
jgi:hypothetical protein